MPIAYSTGLIQQTRYSLQKTFFRSAGELAQWAGKLPGNRRRLTSPRKLITVAGGGHEKEMSGGDRHAL